LEQPRQGNVHKRSRAESGVLCVEDACPKIENCTIKVFTDNTTALKYTTKFGGTASLPLQELAVMIQDLCNRHHLMVTYQHIAGFKNTLADQLSRKQIPLYEQAIPKKLFQQILHQ
jgi:hypothetical protein